jgi:putative aldouronate transport system substrate-binding protein
MKKLLSLMLVLALSLSLLTACGSDSGSGGGTSDGGNATSEGSGSSDSGDSSDSSADTAGGAPERLVILYPGDISNRMESFLANEFAERMLNDLNMVVEMRWLSWGDYWDQKDIMLGAGDAIDLYWDGTPNLPDIINKKNARPLDDLIAAYGQDMLKVLPEDHIQGGSMGGVTYGIPSAFAASSCMFEFVCVRQDILEAVGMTSIKTADDLLQFHNKAKAHDAEIRGGGDSLIRPLNRYFSDVPTTMVAKDHIVFADLTTSKVFSFYESKAFEDLSKFNAQIDFDDDVTIDYNERDTRMQQGLYIWVEGSLGKDNEIGDIVRSNEPDAVIRNYLIAPDKPKYITAAGGEVLCIPHSANNPEGAMKFINWFYASQENYLFAIYGVEGVDYELVNGRINTLHNDELFYEWMFRNKHYQLFTVDDSDEYVHTIQTWDDDALFSPTMGFFFDNSNVLEVELAIQEAARLFEPIRSGYVDFDANYPAALEELKAAGIDEYVAEVQRQLDAFLGK